MHYRDISATIGHHADNAYLSGAIVLSPTILMSNHAARRGLASN